jgi:molecular chaperone HtpG
LMPTYLRFVRGVIDSNDLPLNVSREILQQNKLVDNIRAGAVKKVLGLLDDMADREKDKYATFWKAFGKVLKEGVPEDNANRETIARLLRFTSTASDGDTQDVSLDDYIGRMKEGQDKIYYLTADSYATAKNSPLLEVFRQKGVEVLLLTDMVDNWVVTSLTEYKDKQIQSIAKGELELDKMEDEETKAAQEKAATDFKELTERLKTTLSDRVKEVRVTHRLTSSPSCVVGDENDLDESFKRILKATGQKLPESKPILEINPQHPIIERLREVQDEARFKDWSLILLEQAILTDGGELEDPVAFVSRLNGLLVELSGK